MYLRLHRKTVSGRLPEQVYNSQNQKNTFNIYLDTLHQVELKSLKNDSLEFSQFYEVNDTCPSCKQDIHWVSVTN